MRRYTNPRLPLPYCWLHYMTEKPVFYITYNVFGGMLNFTHPNPRHMTHQRWTTVLVDIFHIVRRQLDNVGLCVGCRHATNIVGRLHSSLF